MIPPLDEVHQPQTDPRDRKFMKLIARIYQPLFTPSSDEKLEEEIRLVEEEEKRTGKKRKLKFDLETKDKIPLFDRVEWVNQLVAAKDFLEDQFYGREFQYKPLKQLDLFRLSYDQSNKNVEK